MHILPASLASNPAALATIKSFAEASVELLKAGDAERRFQSALAKSSRGPLGGESLASLIGRRREELQRKKEEMGISGSPGSDVVSALKQENSLLKNRVDDLESLVKSLSLRVANLEGGGRAGGGAAPAAPAKKPPTPKKQEADDDEDDDVDLFGSDDEEEDAAAAKVREDRLAAYNAKKSKKPVLIAKSSVLIDVKPWDDETDMKLMEEEVRKIELDGLLWGASKLVPLAYGIKKLTINCVIEDDKVSTDWLQEEIEKIEEYVQSTDIAAFNKI